MAVVKANAYGHGAVDISRACPQALGGLPWPRSTKVSHSAKPASPPLSSFWALSSRNISDLVAHRLTPVVSEQRLLPALAKAAGSADQSYPIHLKVETGMGRLGFSPTRLLHSSMPFLRKSLRVEGMMTHLADSDGADQAFTERQLRILPCWNSSAPWCHHPVGAYGEQCRHRQVSPSALFTRAARHHALRYHTCRACRPLLISNPSSHFEPRSSNCERSTRGQSATTGHLSRKGRLPIAVLPIGYADGYSRRLSNRGSVLIQGRRAPIVGLVCMDMIMVDVTDLPPVQVGDSVTLIGQQGGDSIWADDIAEWIGTIPYEVLCGIGPEFPASIRHRLDRTR